MLTDLALTTESPLIGPGSSTYSANRDSGESGDHQCISVAGDTFSFSSPSDGLVQTRLENSDNQEIGKTQFGILNSIYFNANTLMVARPNIPICKLLSIYANTLIVTRPIECPEYVIEPEAIRGGFVVSLIILWSERGAKMRSKPKTA